MTNRSGRFLPWFTALLAACSFGNGPGKRGELGNDRFFYECVADTDAMCDGADLETEPLYGMPRIALGSKFGIDTEGITTEARAANDRVTEEQSFDGVRAFTAKVPGWTTIMSRTYDEEAVDLIHVLVVTPATAELSERNDSSDDWKLVSDTTPLAIDAERQIRVAPFDAEKNPLAGGLDIEWSAEPEGIVEILPKTGDNIVSVRPLGSGAVTVTAKLGKDLTATLSLDVTGEGGGGGGAGGGGGDGGGGGAQGGGGEGGGQ